jgi:sensor histidine kinase regulating citrate/malate metabolism
MNTTTIEKPKSVKSINQCESIIQTIYDNVKAHGGEIKVETKDNEGTEFFIQLPIKNNPC